MGFGAIRMMQSGAPAESDVGAWLPADNFSQSYRATPRPSVAGSNLFTSEPAKEEPAAKPVFDALVAIAPSHGSGFNPMTDPVAGGFNPQGAGASETANGTPGSAAHQTASSKPQAAARPAGAPLTGGESRPFVSGRVTHPALGGKFGQAAVGGGAVGTNFGGSSATSSFDVVSGPAATAGAAGGATLASSFSGASSLTGDPSALGGLNNMPIVGGGGSTNDGFVPQASNAEIAQRQQLLASDDANLRQNVALPAVQLLSNMMNAIDVPSDPRTLDFVELQLQAQGLGNASQFNPTPAAVDSLLAAAVPCLQQLAAQTDLPEDPQGALTCHAEARGAISAYDSWPAKLTGVDKPLGDDLTSNPPWTFVSGQAGGSAQIWAQTTLNVVMDVKNMVTWAHTVKLPSWEPQWELDLDGAYQHLQTANAVWNQLAAAETTDPMRGTLLAYGSQETTAGLASLDQALLDMGGCPGGDAFTDANGNWFGPSGCRQ